MLLSFVDPAAELNYWKKKIKGASKSNSIEADCKPMILTVFNKFQSGYATQKEIPEHKTN